MTYQLLKKSNSIILASLLMIACKSADSSSDVKIDSSGKGGGTDAIARQRKSAWFVGGTKTISICINIADINLDRNTASDLIDRSFFIWKKLISQKVDGADPALQNTYKFPTAYNIQADCSSVDLAIYFGAPPADRTGIFTNGKIDSYGVAHKTPTGNSLWQKGFIWVSGSQNSNYRIREPEAFPRFLDWRDNIEASMILTQHFGYIFGNSEVPGSALDESVVKSMIDKMRPVDTTDRARLLGTYEASLVNMPIKVVPDPKAEFGEDDGACSVGVNPDDEMFIRSAPRQTVRCFFYNRGR